MKDKNKPNKFNYAAFFTAIKKGDKEALNKILEKYDIDVNQPNPRKELPTTVAKVFERGEILEILQERGANIDEESYRSILLGTQDDLCSYIFRGDADSVEYLFKEGRRC